MEPANSLIILQRSARSMKSQPPTRPSAAPDTAPAEPRHTFSRRIDCAPASRPAAGDLPPAEGGTGSHGAPGKDA